MQDLVFILSVLLAAVVALLVLALRHAAKQHELARSAERRAEQAQERAAGEARPVRIDVAFLTDEELRCELMRRRGLRVLLEDRGRDPLSHMRILEIYAPENTPPAEAYRLCQAGVEVIARQFGNGGKGGTS